MKNLMIGAAAAVLLTACGGGSEEDVAGDVADAGAAAVESAEEAIQALGNITLRGGDAGKAEEALAAMSLANSGDGRVTFTNRDISGAAATFTGLSIDIPGNTIDETVIGDDEDGGPHIDVESDFAGGTIEIDTLEFEGLDVTDAGASFARMTLKDVTLVPSEEDEAVDAEVKLGEFELLNPSPEMAAWVASLMGQGEPAAFPTGEALQFDKLSFADFNASGVDDEDGSTADISIASFDIGMADEARKGVAALNGLSMDIVDEEDGGVFNLSLGGFSVAGADTRVLGALAAAAETGDEAAAAELLSEVYSNPVDPGFDRLEISDLAFNGEGITMAMPKLDSFVSRRADGQPVAFVTEPYAFSLSADPDGGEAGGELAGALGMIGFEQIEVSGKNRSTYDPDTDMLSMSPSENVITLADGFSMKFGAELGGYRSYGEAMQAMNMTTVGDEEIPDPTAAFDALGQLMVHGFELEFDDNSIVDRAFNLYAAQSGEDPQELRNQTVGMIAMAPMMAGGMGIDMAIVTEATTALSAFLQSPGTLTIKLDPETPLSAETFSNMDDPSGLTKEFLGLSVTHTE